MKKIGLVSPFPPKKDGIAIYSDNLYQSLKKNEYEIVTIGNRGSNADYNVDFKSFNLQKDIYNIIKKEKIDIIHIQYVAALFGRRFMNINLISALNLSVPVIVTLHEVQYCTKGFKNKILSYIEKKIINKADSIVVHTGQQKKFLEKKYKAENITHIYHGLSLYRIQKSPNNKIIFFGMISKGKGVEYLIKAMQYLPEYHLLIAGRFVDKKTKKSVIKELKALNLKNISMHFGWVGEEQKKTYYKNSDLVVLPYVWAPYQSGVMHDALSWNLPLVVTEEGGLPELVREFRFGEIVKTRSPAEIAKGVKSVFNNYAKYKEGIIRYRKAANWKTVAYKHLTLYELVTRDLKYSKNI
ncbi:glycosyltransferase [Candidatus Woesearchaeota archaeon]|nr:glycosyltransferase [Candidatus Woesearchaeota archaeon]